MIPTTRSRVAAALLVSIALLFGVVACSTGEAGEAPGTVQTAKDPGPAYEPVHPDALRMAAAISYDRAADYVELVTVSFAARAFTPPAPAPVAAVYSGGSGGGGGCGGGDHMAQIRCCESTNNYGAVSSSGTYRGAYQFDQGTWESVGGSGDPAAASPGEQDARAAQLYAQRGSSPWPNCG